MGTGQYRALLVGVSEFPKDPASLLPLGGPAHDVPAVRAALTAAETGLFDVENVRAVSGPTRAELEHALFEFFSSGKRDDVLLFYYSGHGRLTAEGNLFLCAGDTVASRLPVSGISAAFLRQCMDDSPTQTFVVVLDCCHSGAFKGGHVETLKGQGTFILSSSRARQLTNDGDGTGPSPFTAAFVEALTTAETDSDRDGRITFDDVYLRAYERLKHLKQYPQRVQGEGTVMLARARHDVPAARPPSPVPEPLPIAPEPPAMPPIKAHTEEALANRKPTALEESVEERPTRPAEAHAMWRPVHPSEREQLDGPSEPAPKRTPMRPVTSPSRWVIPFVIGVFGLGMGILAIVKHYVGGSNEREDAAVADARDAARDETPDADDAHLDAQEPPHPVDAIVATPEDATRRHPDATDDDAPMETCLDPSAHPGRNPVNIDSAPQGAAIFMNETSCPQIGVTPWQGKLRKGTYTVIFQVRGYESGTHLFNVINSGKQQELFVPLTKTPEPPKIDVRADVDKDVAGATIWLDGSPVGTAPMIVTTTAGHHQLELRKDGFEPASQWVDVADNQVVPLTPSLKPAPKYGSIVVQAEVQNADIYLDRSKYPETTPAVIPKVPVGVHIVEVRKPPAVPESFTVEVKENQPAKVHADLRPPSTGALRVLSETPGARASMDDTDLGPLPVDFSGIKFGIHTISVSAKGYKPQSREVTIGPTQQTIKIDLVEE